MFKALYLSPMVPSTNMKESIAFFRDVLHFKVLMDADTYCIVEKDNLSLHFLPASAEMPEMEFYLEVDHVDALWEEIKDQLAHLENKAPFDQPYGMREIHVKIPKTNCLLYIGEDTVNK